MQNLSSLIINLLLFNSLLDNNIINFHYYLPINNVSTYICVI